MFGAAAGDIFREAGRTQPLPRKQQLVKIIKLLKGTYLSFSTFFVIIFNYASKIKTNHVRWFCNLFVLSMQ